MSVDTPASTSTTSTTATVNEVLTLADEVKKYDIEDLISFLRERELRLDEDDEKIIRNEKITGQDFFDLTQEELEKWGMPGGPAKRLVKFAKECKEKKLRAFSSYRTKKDLKEVLAKHGVRDGRISDITQFTPRPHNIDDKNETLVHCLKDIRLRLRNMGTVVENNEAIRCEYISIILHACINIARELTGKEISLNPQFEVVSEENTGRVDYAIKSLEELICITEGKQYQISIGFAQNIIQCESAIQTNKRKRKADNAFGEEFDYLFGIVTIATEWHFLLYTPDEIFCTSKNPLNIRFVETALKEDSEDGKELCKNVKRVVEVIVGLLKERVSVEKEPKNKKARVQEYSVTHNCISA